MTPSGISVIIRHQCHQLLLYYQCAQCCAVSVLSAVLSVCSAAVLQKANPNHKISKGRKTALHFAVHKKHVAVAELLVRKGADTTVPALHSSLTALNIL